MKRRHRLRKHRFQPRSDLIQPGEVPLNDLRAGERGVILRIIGGRMMRARMTSLGFVPGTEVLILQNFGHGPLIVQAHDARIALGRRVAGGIQIRRNQV
jgi:ferrous iron transport protein A